MGEEFVAVRGEGVGRELTAETLESQFYNQFFSRAFPLCSVSRGSERGGRGNEVAGMGWLRLVGSLKLYVSLENIGLLCRALLRKKRILLRSLLSVATP